jgi:nicotinate-nucleotide adenylyltransferase
MAVASRLRIGVFGGTFDPIHFGHLRMALELHQQLALTRVHMVVASVPPHRDQPVAAPAHRLAMLQRAVDHHVGLQADDRELRRTGPSFMIDTLAEFRAEYGQEAAICLAMGADAFAGLTGWERWEQLLDLAHLVVMARPAAPALSAQLQTWAHPHWSDDHEAALTDTPAGRILRVELSQLAISATAIRAQFGAGSDPGFLLPDTVIDYIEQHRLYVEQGA